MFKGIRPQGTLCKIGMEFFNTEYQLPVGNGMDSTITTSLSIYDYVETTVSSVQGQYFVVYLSHRIHGFDSAEKVLRPEIITPGNVTILRGKNSGRIYEIAMRFGGSETWKSVRARHLSAIETMLESVDIWKIRSDRMRFYYTALRKMFTKYENIYSLLPEFILREPKLIDV